MISEYPLMNILSLIGASHTDPKYIKQYRQEWNEQLRVQLIYTNRPKQRDWKKVQVPKYQRSTYPENKTDEMVQYFIKTDLDVFQIDNYFNTFDLNMPFNATVDIFLNFSYLQVRFLNRHGFLSYRIKLFYSHHKSIINCQPYNIIRGKKQTTQLEAEETDFGKQSEIDHHTDHYYSRVIPVRYRPADYHENQTVFFKAYIDTHHIESIKFQCQIECLFSQIKEGQYDVIGTFNGKIHRIFNVSTYMPISFDAFEGFNIRSTFHATIMDFKYSESNLQGESYKGLPLDKKTFDFWSYLDTLTKGFNRDSLYKFYVFYRDFLIKELQYIQEKHRKLIKTFKLSQKYQVASIPPNKDLQNLILDKSFQSHSIILPSSQTSVIHLIENEYSLIKGHLYEKWMQFSQFVSQHSVQLANHLREEYLNESRDRFKNNMFSHRITNHNWIYSKYSDSGKTSLEKAFVIKKHSFSDEEMWIDRFPIEKTEHFGKKQTNIKIFEEVYENPAQSLKVNNDSKASRHIIVLVHGFQASRQDFFLFKNCIQVNYGVHVLISTCNEGLTESSINIAGKRLAIQMKKMLVSFKGDYRLSFIGHSMGGLIIRAAIPDLKAFENHFYTYMSLSSPHLGYLYQSSTLVRAGLWLLNTINKCDSLLQMSMQDKQNLRKTTLYNLAFNKSLQKFDKICFLCSSQDEYVVYESARVQLNEDLITAKMSKETQQIVREMVEGILGGAIEAKQISRINVVFNIDDRNLDSFLGRTGHIKFLNDIQFIRQFVACFDKFFL